MNKILCLIDGLSLGGAERQLIGLAYLLKCNGYEVELCSYVKRTFYDELISTYGIKAVCLDIEGGKLEKFMAVRKYLKRGMFDCVIAYKDGAAFAASALKLLGMKYKLIVSERNTNVSRTIYDNFKFRLFSFADYIIPNSYSQKEFIIVNYPSLKNKVVTITNFTDIKYFVPSAIQGSDKHVVQIMVAARIASQKNIIRFLTVVKKLKDSHLAFHVTWFGDASYGEVAYEIKCKKLIAELGINDVFTFKPATKNILKEYQMCDVFCLPSLFEGYPNSICEAMSCGKPILCSRVCDNHLIVKDGMNGILFNPEDEDEIYAGMRRLIIMPEAERNSMGRKSRIIAENSFSEDSFIAKYIKLIET